MSHVSRLALGCAKFGLRDYPPGSASSQPTPNEARAILRGAYDLGIRHFDVSRNYGAAEDLIGWALQDCPDVSVTTKTAPEYLVQARLHSPYRPLLLHNPTPEQLWLYQNMADGASVNAPGEAHVAIAAGYKHLQFPHWILDQRYAKAGVFEAAQRQGVTVYARQPFGRGTVFALVSGMRALSDDDAEAVMHFKTLCCRYQIDWAGAALRFSLECPADYIVLGVASIAQLEQDVAIAASDPPPQWAACYAELCETFRDSGLALGSVCTPEGR